MNLLLIDKDGLPTKARKEILTFRFHFNVESAETLDDVRVNFHAGKYDVIIMNESFEIVAEALEMIEQIDPEQRIVILDSDVAGERNLEHQNRRYLSLPVSIMELANVIRDFDYTGTKKPLE